MKHKGESCDWAGAASPALHIRTSAMPARRDMSTGPPAIPSLGRQHCDYHWLVESCCAGGGGACAADARVHMPTGA